MVEEVVYEVGDADALLKNDHNTSVYEDVKGVIYTVYWRDEGEKIIKIVREV